MNVDDAISEVNTNIRPNPEKFSPLYREVVIALADEVERLRSHEQVLRLYQQASDEVFQLCKEVPNPILPDFLTVGDSKVTGIVRLAKAYRDLKAEVERLRAEVDFHSEAGKGLIAELAEKKAENDKLKAELAAAKAASVCPVEVVACDPDYERKATVVLWSNADAQRFAGWLRDCMKEKGNQ